jgi:hypothetical protein
MLKSKILTKYSTEIATAPLFEILSIDLVFLSPSKNQSKAAFMNSTNLFSGDAKNGNYTTNMSFSPSSEGGVWILEYLIVCDKPGRELMQLRLGR